MSQIERIYALLSKIAKEGLLPVVCLVIAIIYVWQDRAAAISAKEAAYSDAQRATREFLAETRQDRLSIVDVIGRNSDALTKTINALEDLRESQERLTTAIREQTSETYSRNNVRQPAKTSR